MLSNLVFLKIYNTDFDEIILTFTDQNSGPLEIFFDLPPINCEIELYLLRARGCVLIEHHNNITRVNFMITSTKLHVPVVTLSVNDNIKFLENIKQGAKIF